MPLVLGAVVVLAGLGIGIWLATGGSTSTNSNQATANELFDAGLQAQLHNKPALAVNDYLRSLELDPKNPVSWYDLGLIEQQTGYRASAQHDYEESIADDPRYVPALYNLGTIVASTDPARAVTLYEKVIAIEPGYAQAHLNLGFALQAIGKVDEGNSQIAQAIHLDPSLSSRVPASTTPASGTP
jgi:tetratricopeptide (TPR) repeat protein